MSEADFYDVLQRGLWVGLVISTPMLAAALITGVVIGLFQALTSIQEMTLTFVPKLIVILLVFWVGMGFMTNSLKDFFEMEIIPRITANHNG